MSMLTNSPRTSPNIALWVEIVPIQEPNRNYNSWERTEARKHMIQYVLEGMRKYIKKPVNYEVKGVTQEEKENLAIFYDNLWKLLENLLTLTSPFPRINPCWNSILSATLPLILGGNSKSYDQAHKPQCPNS